MNPTDTEILRELHARAQHAELERDTALRQLERDTALRQLEQLTRDNLVLLQAIEELRAQREVLGEGLVVIRRLAITHHVAGARDPWLHVIDQVDSAVGAALVKRGGGN